MLGRVLGLGDVSALGRKSGIDLNLKGPDFGLALEGPGLGLVLRGPGLVDLVYVKTFGPVSCEHQHRRLK